MKERPLLEIFSKIKHISLIAAFMLNANSLNATQVLKNLHSKIITFDAEIDIPFEFMEKGFDVGFETDMQIDLPKMDRGKLDGALFVIWVRQGERTPEAYRKAFNDANKKLLAIEKMVEKYPERIRIALSPSEAELIAENEKHFAVIGMVNAWPLGENLENLEELHRRGLRQITLTHAGHNQFADSSRPSSRLKNTEKEHNGLSGLGRNLVKKMNKLGIIIDVSQATPEVVFETANLSNSPIVASHSGVKRIVNNRRNLSDAEMIAIQKTGGAVGIVAFSSYLQSTPPEQGIAFQRISKLYGTSNLSKAKSILDKETLINFKKDIDEYEKKFPRASLEQYVDSIEYAVNLIGIDHVMISSDMEHGGGVIGWMDAGESYNVTKELKKRGFSEQQIAKLWWKNFYRVWENVMEN